MSCRRTLGWSFVPGAWGDAAAVANEAESFGFRRHARTAVMWRVLSWVLRRGWPRMVYWDAGGAEGGEQARRGGVKAVYERHVLIGKSLGVETLGLVQNEIVHGPRLGGEVEEGGVNSLSPDGSLEGVLKTRHIGVVCDCGGGFRDGLGAPVVILKTWIWVSL